MPLTKTGKKWYFTTTFKEKKTNQPHPDGVEDKSGVED